MKIIMRCFFLMPIFVSSFLCNAQETIYEYKSKKGITSLSNGDHVVTFSQYARADSKTKKRTANANGTVYSFNLIRTRHGKVQEIYDAQDKKIATVLLGVSNKYDVLLPDGTQFKLSDKRNRGWTYLRADDEMVSYSLLKRKRILVAPSDSTLVPPVLPLICLEQAAEKIDAISRASSVSVVLSMTAVMLRTAATNYD